jgi:hypothetical protein
MVTSIEEHVERIGTCLVHLREHECRSIEAPHDAQDAWVEHARSLVDHTVVTDPRFLGTNVPDRKRVYVPYAGGCVTYRRECDGVADGGYIGFKLA